MMQGKKVFIVLSVLSFLGAMVECRKVLMVPASQISHVMESVLTAEALVSRGHEVHMVLPSNFPKMQKVKDSGITPMVYDVPKGGITYAMGLQDFLDPFGQTLSKGVELAETIKLMKGECRLMLNDIQLMGKLAKEHYDLSVTDGFILAKCLFLVPYNLSVPYVYLFTSFVDLELGIPALPSFVVPFVVPLSPNMSFLERIQNIVAHQSMLSLAEECEDEVLRQTFAPGISSFLDIVRRSQLFIATRDHVLEYPAPTLPNVVRVPPLTLADPKPLPKEFHSLVINTAGIVVVSFGTSIDKFPIDVFNKFLRAFDRFADLKFFFRVSEELIRSGQSSVPKNVKLLTWMPQQDIIGHPKTRLFITHCGNNGQYEAAYHGVPMLGFPLFGDQQHNCHRMKVQGIGEYLNIVDFTEDQLIQHIELVLTNPKYFETIKQKSAILRDQPHPKDIVASWLEHIMKFGGEHLRSQSQNIPTYQFLMLDIIAILFIILSSSFILFVCIFRLLIKRCLKGRPKHKVA